LGRSDRLGVAPRPRPPQPPLDPTPTPCNKSQSQQPLLNPPRRNTIESSSFKGLEFVVIVGVVVWFYFKQMRNLKTLKEEREAKQQAETSGEQPSAADSSTKAE